MELNEIRISNFRSVENLNIKLPIINGSTTYSLLGINESGKSSILHAISLLDMHTQRIQYPNDYFNINSAVEVSAHYTFTDEDHKSLIEELKKSEKFPKPLLSQIRVNSVIINCSYRANETADLEICETVEFEKRIFDEY